MFNIRNEGQSYKQGFNFQFGKPHYQIAVMLMNKRWLFGFTPKHKRFYTDFHNG